MPYIYFILANSLWYTYLSKYVYIPKLSFHNHRTSALIFSGLWTKLLSVVFVIFVNCLIDGKKEVNSKCVALSIWFSMLMRIKTMLAAIYMKLPLRRDSQPAGVTSQQHKRFWRNMIHRGRKHGHTHWLIPLPSLPGRQVPSKSLVLLWRYPSWLADKEQRGFLTSQSASSFQFQKF